MSFIWTYREDPPTICFVGANPKIDLILSFLFSQVNKLKEPKIQSTCFFLIKELI